MVVDDLFSVVHVAVTDLDYVAIKDFFLSLWSSGKCLSTRARNLCPILMMRSLNPLMSEQSRNRLVGMKVYSLCFFPLLQHISRSTSTYRAL